MKQITITINFLLLLSLFSCNSCDGPTGTNDDKYDTRNITRIDEHIESVSINATDSEGNPHVVFQSHVYSEPINVGYIYRKSNGKWSDALNISNTTEDSQTPHIAIDSEDNIHVVWEDMRKCQTYYTTKSKNGDWSQPVVIIDESAHRPQIEIDKYDNIHVVADGFRGVYRERKNGIWLDKEGMGPPIQNHELAISKNGDVHVAFEAGDTRIGYIYKPANGEWQDMVFLADNDNKRKWWVDMFCDDSGKAYISWNVKYEDQIKFIIKGLDGQWSKIDSIPDMVGDPWVSKMVVKNDEIHFIWNSSIEQYDYDIFYQKKSPAGKWSEREQISLTEDPSLDPAICLYENIIHITWHEKFGEPMRSNRDIYYETIEIK